MWDPGGEKRHERVAEDVVRPITTGESDDEALSLVRRDLQSSEKFKKEFCPTEKIQLRRRAYEGDPDAYDFPYDSEWGARLVNNWMLRQINHKVGKLSKSPSRLNTSDANGDDDDETRLRMVAIRRRLEFKAREARWHQGRRRMLLDAAKVGFGVRCVGLKFDRGRWVIRNWRVRGEEFHMDPTAEFMLDDAEWTSWRRYVTSTKLSETLARLKGIAPAGAGASLSNDTRPQEISLSDDQIIAQGRSLGDKGASLLGVDPILVTDYYRVDQSQDFYYQCPGCGRMAGVSQVEQGGSRVPVFKCAACKKELRKAPPRDQIKRNPRYPNGRHIRILGGGTIDYRGPNRMRLEDVHPFVGAVWYEGETWNGISEVQQLQSAQIYNDVVMSMLADNAFSGGHSKIQVPKDGIVSGWGNSTDRPLEVSTECWSAGGAKTLQPADISSSARVLLDRSIQDLFLLAANSPESQGQAPETLRSGVGFRSVVAASEVGLYLNLEGLMEADARFYRIVRDLCGMVDRPTQIQMIAPDGTPGTYQYDRSLMGPQVEIEIRTDRDVDAEREELFSRGMEMRQLQVQGVDDGMLLELSGIPDDIIRRARERVAAQPPLGPAGLPPEINTGLAPTGMPGQNGNAVPSQAMNRLAGKMAPKPSRPPSRSRGQLPAGAGMGGA